MCLFQKYYRCLVCVPRPGLVYAMFSVRLVFVYVRRRGSKHSFFGDIKAQGYSARDFFTEPVTIMEKWQQDEGDTDIHAHWKS